MDKLLNRFGYFKKKNKPKYKQIIYSDAGTPEQNSTKLLLLATQANECMRSRLAGDFYLMGVLFSTILFIEFHLVQVISSICDDAEKLTFGPKIDVFKEFLKIYDFEDAEEERRYRMLLAPLHEIKKIRNLLAHNLDQHTFESESLRKTETYIQNIDPENYQLILGYKTDQERCDRLLTIFGVVCTFQLAEIRMSLT